MVEDVFTTWNSTCEVRALVKEAGARPIAAGSIVNRGLGPRALAVPTRSLLNLELPAWPEGECPLCRQGIPLDTPGSRYGTAG